MSHDTAHARRSGDGGREINSAVLALGVDDDVDGDLPTLLLPIDDEPPPPSPTELLETAKRKMSITNDRSPRAYQKIAVGDMDSNGRHDSPDSMSSLASRSRERKFACQFDPSSKNGRALVLTFDARGVGTFQEMTRLDLLRRTHDAARSSINLFEPGVVASDARAAATSAGADELSGGAAGRRGRVNRKASLRGPFVDHAERGPQYATICDVQVRMH